MKATNRCDTSRLPGRTTKAILMKRSTSTCPETRFIARFWTLWFSALIVTVSFMASCKKEDKAPQMPPAPPSAQDSTGVIILESYFKNPQPCTVNHQVGFHQSLDYAQQSQQSGIVEYWTSYDTTDVHVTVYTGYANQIWYVNHKAICASSGCGSLGAVIANNVGYTYLPAGDTIVLRDSIGY